MHKKVLEKCVFWHKKVLEKCVFWHKKVLDDDEAERMNDDDFDLADFCHGGDLTED